MSNTDKLQACKWCNGGGMEHNYLPCPDCEGTGYKGGKLAVEQFEKEIDNMCELQKEVKT